MNQIKRTSSSRYCLYLLSIILVGSGSRGWAATMTSNGGNGGGGNRGGPDGGISAGEFLHQSGSDHLHRSPKDGRCEAVTIPMCLDMPYNETILPNLMGHATQEQAGYEAHQYYALVKVSCSPSLKIFLCALFAPVCNILHEALPPCRSLCETSRLGCEKLLSTFGLPWPEYLECSRFPVNNGLCVNGNVPPDVDSVQSAGGSHLNSGSIHQGINFTNGGTYHPGLPPTPGGHSLVTEKELVCPADWKIPEHTIGDKLQDCGPPCNLFSSAQKKGAAIVVGVVAASTLISSLFTIITAALDSNRFHYPERAIVHLAVCYAALAICYIIGAIGMGEISCNDGFIVVGPGSASCTLLFMFTYFLTFASHLWWVLLSLTWYLSAGLKWGGEAIAAYSLYFHLSAWGISAFMTMAAVALGYVEGDPLAGPCSLGLQKSPELQYFMMYPLMILIAIGTLFFIMGFLALFRIRREIKRSSTVTSTGSDKVFTSGGQRSLLWDQSHEISNNVIRAGAARLEILMARIGVFSILYTVPAVVFLVSLLYISTPLSSGGILLPIFANGSQRRDNQALFVMYLIRYISNLGFGSALIVWIWSRKTLMTWKRAICGPQVK